jgi:galactonate dehydratase
MLRLVSQAAIPSVVATLRLTTKYEFARVLECRAASILQMALGRVGGIMEAKKVAGMAEAYYAQIAPHLYAGPVEGAANVHFATSLPNSLSLESIETWGGFHAQILKNPIKWQDGFVIPPKEPGLGIELNEDVARAHPYLGTQLHLEMTNHPVR